MCTKRIGFLTGEITKTYYLLGAISRLIYIRHAPSFAFLPRRTICTDFVGACARRNMSDRAKLQTSRPVRTAPSRPAHAIYTGGVPLRVAARRTSRARSRLRFATSPQSSPHHVTEILQRPLACRRLSTLRPFLVLKRLKKPCVRFRFRTCARDQAW